jgi:hypothetical protein
MENWLPVVGFEGLYEVSDCGRVRTVKTGKIKTFTKHKGDNRPFFLLWQGNKPKASRPHTLVLAAFVCPRPDGMEGCHNDGNPWNNNLPNLRWDTPQANQADRVRHGTTNRGERCGAAKLTLEQVRAIRADTRLQRLIAADYGVAESAISRIKGGKRWQHDT